MRPNLAPMSLALPYTLSPSKVASFTDCPLAFRYSIIDRLPEPPSPHAVKGTLVHTALERLFWEHPPGQRTPDAALAELTTAWTALQEDPEFQGLGLDQGEADEFFADATDLVGNYFQLEDPNVVRTVGVELGMESAIGGVRLRGIIDRLDLDEDGNLVVVDYKTGRAPSERFEQGRLAGVHLYALLCERVLGRAPAAVHLLHLRDPLDITAVPTSQKLRGQHQRTVAIWRAIERACAAEDFRPRPSPLCGSCSFKEFCPAFGGIVPTTAIAS